MPVLSNRASFWTSAAVVAIALWASGSPAMIYPVYVAEWNLPSVVVTSIFAVYPIVLVPVIIVFGGISDVIGRRATLLAGLAALALGILLFALAPNVGWLFAGRALQGIGVGLAMSPASAAMVEFGTGGSARSSSINTAATSVGLALATIAGGALVQYAPLPTHLSFWVLLAATAVVAGFAWFMPRRAGGSTERWRPRGLVVPKGLGLIVFTAALSIASGFMMGALMLSLGSQIAKDLVGTDNALVVGAVISLSAVAIGVLGILGRRLAPRTAILAGGFTTAAGMLLLLLSAMASSFPLFIAASLVAGSGYGLLFLGGLGLINAAAPVHHRAQTLSVVYLIAYLGQGAIAVSIGLSATVTGLRPAVELWTPIIAAFCIAASILAIVTAHNARAVVRPAI